MATIEPYETKSGTRYRVRYRKPDGKPTDKRGFTTKRDAKAFAATVEVKKMTGDFIEASAGRITIDQLGKEWTENRTGVVAKTVATGESTWNVHVQPRWGTRSVGEIKPSEIRAWVAGMQAEEVGAATIEKAVGQLRQILEAAVEDRRIPRNPCQGVKAPKHKHIQRGYLTHSQVHQLAGEVSSHGLVVLFLAYTGLRWGEMAALKIKSFDMLRRRVNITEAVSEVKGELVWGNVKTHERRSVPFPKFLAESLARQMEGKGREDLVFPGESGAVLRVSNYRPRVFAMAVARCKGAALRQRAKEAQRGKLKTPEFPTITPHDLRHTAASLSISAGANVKAVQTMLGHKSAAMTLDTYADLFPDDLEAVSDALDRAARASVGKKWAAS
ncbi:tyrosine-type recombinase/integrase [Nocardia terpenica]|uniref:Site-specific integrase n=1 Tax=Nocardia terpenica TaxID=455432 RepID=A0A291RSR1_9NOCA|nr:site-specific integrase [Nocardia terpenica]ATL70596.1 site-specific integrase [Nocardia terpenica]